MPKLIESASMDENGVITSTIVNVSLDAAKDVKCQIAASEVKTVKAEILTGAMDDYNGFDHAEVACIEDFDALTVENGALTFTIPACSVMEITVS